jgi:opacity protein-like surface antigen
MILVTIICLLTPGATRPAGAVSGDRILQMTVPVIGIWATSAIVHYLWKNSPAQRAQGYRENLGPGEWYVAAYTGLSHLPRTDWNFYRRFSAPLRERTAREVCSEPGIVGGLKFGRYFDSLPWLGMEMEMNFSRHAIREQSVSISPSLPAGPTKLRLPRYRFYIWDMQVNLLARYGFLQDKEVTFGRLQPYLGIGPGFEVLYGITDSAKNFAVETLAGIRYMCTKNIALYCEYKFSYQFEVEIEHVSIPPYGSGTVMLDVPHHRIVFGVAYHFKNLFGN